MGTMSPQKLLNKWEREEITIEMAIGHILQHFAKIKRPLMLSTSPCTIYELQLTA